MQLTLQYDKFYVLYNYIIKIGYNSITNRNLQKRAKKARYESEKAFMETLRGVGCTVGEYAGDGREETDMSECMVMDNPAKADPVDSLDEQEDGCMPSSADYSRPLLVLYDCKATGLSIYSDHITDIAAKVMNPPVAVPSATFSSLVRTGKTISATGK